MILFSSYNLQRWNALLTSCTAISKPKGRQDIQENLWRWSWSLLETCKDGIPCSQHALNSKTKMFLYLNVSIYHPQHYIWKTELTHITIEAEEMILFSSYNLRRCNALFASYRTASSKTIAVIKHTHMKMIWFSSYNLQRMNISFTSCTASSKPKAVAQAWNTREAMKMIVFSKI